MASMLEGLQGSPGVTQASLNAAPNQHYALF